ncbi:hypothetical protein KEJ19_06380 [Candidatus Bathyarchaeota archaeon]|nr:hypothetical protein [Candidatus Bathyarchaeota archaeon]
MERGRDSRDPGMEGRKQWKMASEIAYLIAFFKPFQTYPLPLPIASGLCLGRRNFRTPVAGRRSPIIIDH